MVACGGAGGFDIREREIERVKVRLRPANPNYPPQFYDDVRIQGKLIGVIRRLD